MDSYFKTKLYLCEKKSTTIRYVCHIMTCRINSSCFVHFCRSGDDIVPFFPSIHSGYLSANSFKDGYNISFDTNCCNISSMNGRRPLGPPSKGADPNISDKSGSFYDISNGEGISHNKERKKE